MFTLGINHPWVDCGHDFGPRPPPWQGGAPRDWPAVARDLRRWREAAGVTVTRFWILAAGKNYPVGADPLGVFDRAPFPRAGRGAERLLPRGPLPTLGDGFLDDLAALLGACAEAGVRLMPVLASFELFHPLEEQGGGVLSRGRGALVFGTTRDAAPRQLRAFLDATLEPVLDVLATRPAAVAAVDLMNEPDWPTVGGPRQLVLGPGRPRFMAKTVPGEAMSALLAEGVERVLRRGLVATIGFKEANPGWLSAGLRRRLAALGRGGRYIHQLHHYPSPHELRRLPAHERLPFQPCWVGELPTAIAWPPTPHAIPWPDEPRTLGEARDPERYLARRLRIIRARGYPGALLWGARSTEGLSAWGPAQWRQCLAKDRAPPQAFASS